MIQGLWDCEVNIIINIKICDAETDTYKYEPYDSAPGQMGPN